MSDNPNSRKPYAVNVQLRDGEAVRVEHHLPQSRPDGPPPGREYYRRKDRYVPRGPLADTSTVERATLDRERGIPTMPNGDRVGSDWDRNPPSAETRSIATAVGWDTLEKLAEIIANDR